MENRKYIAILVELDCLLDTRMGILFDRNNPYNLDDYLKSKQYFSREEDSFPTMSREDYEKRWKTRDRSILKDSILTGVVQEIRDSCCQLTLLKMKTPETRDIKVMINIYPYKLGVVERNKILLAMDKSLNGMAELEIVEKSYDDITVDWVRNEIDYMWMYRWWEWLELKSDEFSKRSCVNTTLFCPRLYMDKSVLDSKVRMDRDYYFKMLSEVSRMLIDLQFIDIEKYCFVH
jgi:hypothetical protein